jgi:hypothetical protein
MDFNSAFSSIIKGIESTMNSNGFSVIVPADTEKGALPVSEKNGASILTYGGKNGTIKIEYFEGKISLLCALSQSDSAVDQDFKKVSTSLFDIEAADHRDIKYIVNDFSDGINDTYGKKEKAKKLPQPVSKRSEEHTV